MIRQPTREIRATSQQECTGANVGGYGEALAFILSRPARIADKLVALECPHCKGVHAYWRGTVRVFEGMKS